ncbi:S8 family serine peptidase [Pirellulimonas nuda]|uniref:S8 family serine peptidase n=1 Tax=Pirellulimonas nuda TaxID=2528009 RepID=UPI0018D2F023|nr:S8 family serine peptidase [Pirellulimonas nuda]
MILGVAVCASHGAHSTGAPLGLSGAGQTLVVIDSGLAYNHPAFAGRYVGGWDFAENDADPYDEKSVGLGDRGSHGTHVTGVAASGSLTNPGVAPGADIVSLRVFDDQGAVYFSWVEKALRWVRDNLHTYRNPITTVNLSIGSSWNANSPPQWGMLEDELADLRKAGVFVAASAGNEFASFGVAGLNYPSSSPSVTAAMAWQTSGLANYSQRSQQAIAAPGAHILGPAPDYMGNGNGLDDDWAYKSGTSMAAPYVAGASMLIREAMGGSDPLSVTPAHIYDTLRSTADPFFDPATQKTYQHINLEAAIQSVAAPIAGDLNHDGFVDAADYTAWRDGLGVRYTQGDLDVWRSAFSAAAYEAVPGDFNRDGSVDAADYTTWRDGLGTKYSQQDYQVWKNAFAGSAVAALPGDFNGDGAINAADYTVWRDTLGSTTQLNADANRDRRIDGSDLAVWRAAMQGAAALGPSSVPEPSAVTIAGLLLVLAAARRSRSRLRASRSRLRVNGDLPRGARQA